ncbi:MAG TPA: SLBB domain-containing protein, partial [Gemmatimonadaceae bacterium]
MRQSFARLAGLGFALLTIAAPARAQGRPTPEQARQLLQTRPDLVQQLRDRLQSSGLTPDQVRARLRAEGYPEDLLDAYLSDGDSTAAATPDARTFAAIRALGIADSLDLDTLRMGMGARSGAGAGLGDTLASRLNEVVCDTVPADSSLAQSADARATGPRPTGAQPTGAERPDTALLDSAMLADAGASRGPRLVCRTRAGVAVAPPDSGFTIFGLDLFAKPTSLFEANVTGPVSDSYRLGPGDQLVLILTGDVENAYTLDVTREGFVVIPQVGQLYVANLTLGELNDLLYTRLGRVYSGIRRGAGATTHFSVSVARLRVNQVFVVGDVARPGSYRVSSAGTALSALYAAGGPTENGSLRRIEIRRGGKLVDVLDVYDYLLRGDASHDARLESGDVVFVPVHGARVRVVGEVIRPATYELEPGETLADAIRAAGGYTATASRERVQVERILPPSQRVRGGRDRVVLDITPAEGGRAGSGSDAGSGGEGGGGNGASGAGTAVASSGDLGATLPMMPGDVVRVFPIAARVRNRIGVVGSVWSPGAQGFTPGMRLSEAIQRAGGLKPDAYLGEVLITRYLPDSSRVQLRSGFRDGSGVPTTDIPLQEDDQIRVFSVADFRPRRYVSISGAVRKSGRVMYREGMTLRDLVLMAGGLEESAYLERAEVARLPENRAGGVTARTFSVPLDSSYLFERGPDGKYLGPPGLPAPEGPAPEVVLHPYDNVLILRQPDWHLQRTVVVAGEVKFPGRYTLVNKEERLGDVIQRAGGITDAAYAGGVTFYRREGRVGRIGVDLPSVLKDGRSEDNLLLQDGDSIFVPRYSGVVQVAGAVNAPVGVAYVPGQNLDYYVRAAGGPSRKADMKRAYVTQANGKVESVKRHALWPDAVPRVDPGARVFVPERDPNDHSAWQQTLP